MKSGKLILTKGFIDAYPEVLSRIKGYQSEHSDKYGHNYIYDSYADAEKEKERIEFSLGEGFTRGLYVESINPKKEK